jgi:hypothetical protein
MDRGSKPPNPSLVFIQRSVLKKSSHIKRRQVPSVEGVMGPKSDRADCARGGPVI